MELGGDSCWVCPSCANGQRLADRALVRGSFLLADCALELRPCGMKARLHRAIWNAEDVGDLFDRCLIEIAEGEQGALIGTQAIESAHDEIALGDPVIDDAGGRDKTQVLGEPRLMSRSTALGAYDATCFVDQDPGHPGVEPVGFAEGADVTPSDRERLLDSVAGIGLIARDRGRQTNQADDARIDERVERGAVAGLGSLDQV